MLIITRQHFKNLVLTGDIGVMGTGKQTRLYHRFCRESERSCTMNNNLGVAKQLPETSGIIDINYLIRIACFLLLFHEFILIAARQYHSNSFSLTLLNDQFPGITVRAIDNNWIGHKACVWW